MSESIEQKDDPFFEGHACLTGDCPHPTQKDCLEAAYNQCKKDMLEGAGKDFDDWWFRNAPPEKKNDEFFRAMASSNPKYPKAKSLWQAGQLSSQKKIDELEEQLKHSKANIGRLYAEYCSQRDYSEKLEAENKELRGALGSIKKITHRNDYIVFNIAKEALGEQ